jgi:hypothetical protein
MHTRTSAESLGLSDKGRIVLARPTDFISRLTRGDGALGDLSNFQLLAVAHDRHQGSGMHGKQFGTDDSRTGAKPSSLADPT